MLDQKTTEIARQLIHPQLAERHDAFVSEITSLIAQAAKDHSLHSGGFVHRLGQLASAEIKIRVRLVAGDLMRVVSECRLPYSADLEANLLQEIEIHARDVETAVAGAVIPIIQRFQPQQVHVPALLADARGRAVELVKGEVGVFVHRLATAESVASTRSDVNIHVEGNVGAMLTGDYSTARVVQHFGAEEKQVVERALVAVREYIAAQGRNIPELTEIVDEAEVETKKGKPNLAKLGGLLSGAAMLIQTAAAAKPAYDAVKAALAVLGIAG